MKAEATTGDGFSRKICGGPHTWFSSPTRDLAFVKKSAAGFNLVSDFYSTQTTTNVLKRLSTIFLHFLPVHV